MVYLKGDLEVDCYHDHRIAMMGYIAGLINQNPVKSMILSG